MHDSTYCSGSRLQHNTWLFSITSKEEEDAPPPENLRTDQSRQVYTTALTAQTALCSFACVDAEMKAKKQMQQQRLLRVDPLANPKGCAQQHSKPRQPFAIWRMFCSCRSKKMLYLLKVNALASPKNCAQQHSLPRQPSAAWHVVFQCYKQRRGRCVTS